jgi:hypothetical protein
VGFIVAALLGVPFEMMYDYSLGTLSKNLVPSFRIHQSYCYHFNIMPSENWLVTVLAFGKRLVAGHRREQELRRLPLQERHRDIIERTEQSMGLNDWQGHYVDDLTAQCLRDIAVREGRSDAAPRAGEFLSQWRRRTGIQQEYLELAQYLKGRLQNR